MLTQQQIEQLLKNSSKHRTASSEEVALLQAFLSENFADIQDIKHVKVVAETNDELSFSFQQQSNNELADQYFMTIAKK